MRSPEHLSRREFLRFSTLLAASLATTACQRPTTAEKTISRPTPEPEGTGVGSLEVAGFQFDEANFEKGTVRVSLFRSFGGYYSILLVYHGGMTTINPAGDMAEYCVYYTLEVSSKKTVLGSTNIYHPIRLWDQGLNKWVIGEPRPLYSQFAGPYEILEVNDHDILVRGERIEDGGCYRFILSKPDLSNEIDLFLGVGWLPELDLYLGAGNTLTAYYQD